MVIAGFRQRRRRGDAIGEIDDVCRRHGGQNRRRARQGQQDAHHAGRDDAHHDDHAERDPGQVAETSPRPEGGAGGGEQRVPDRLERVVLDGSVERVPHDPDEVIVDAPRHTADNVVGKIERINRIDLNAARNVVAFQRDILYTLSCPEKLSRLGNNIALYYN